MSAQRPVDPAALDGTGPLLPAVVLRAGFAVVAVLLAVAVLPPDWWLAPAFALAAAAVVTPRLGFAWLLMVLLAVAQFWHPPTVGDWRPYLLLLGVQVLHLLAQQTSLLPWRSWLAVGVLRGPLLRLVAVQVPAQALLAGALALTGLHAAWAPLALVAALALLGLGALLALRRG